VSWDSFQHAVLSELGLRAYTLAGAAPAGQDLQSAPEAAGASPGELPPALLAALARAAGCAPDQVLELARITRMPADAAARRALWPRLRRLRSRAR
jgi:hypothetical protein